jgi:hypothetical protein
MERWNKHHHRLGDSLIKWYCLHGGIQHRLSADNLSDRGRNSISGFGQLLRSGHSGNSDGNAESGLLLRRLDGQCGFIHERQHYSHDECP